MRALIVATVVILSGVRVEGQDCQDVGGTSPIVINFGTGGYLLTGPEAPVEFDIRATGQRLRIGWTAAGADEAFLCLDRDHSGRIENGAELFGNATPMSNGTTARHGFVALAEYDENQDVVIDENDAIWTQLFLWRDLNHDGISQPSEIMEVVDSTLRAIRLDAHWTGRRDSTGNAFRYESKVWIQRQRTATPEPVYDIFFAQWPADDRAAARSLPKNVPDDREAVGRNETLDSLWPQVTETYDRLHSPQTRGEQSSDSDVEFREAIRRLAAEPPEVAREYEHLASEPFESRTHLIAALPSSMKSALWVHHLLSAVTTHPEFTAEQQSVIYDAIRLLSPELYETGPATGRKDLHDLTLRAQRLFSPEVALSLFVEIGSAIPIASAPEAGVELNESTSRSRTEGDQRALPKRDENAHRPFKPKPMAMDCACSVWNDWCAVAHFPGDGWSCHPTICNLRNGCGLLSSYTCNGLCVYTEPPPTPT